MRYPILTLSILVLSCAPEAGWQSAQAPLMTRWAADVSASNARPEYPRPTLRRDDWLNLNGLWDYAITARDAEPTEYTSRILVPFPVESALSGVRDTVGPGRRVWYSREFDLPDDWEVGRVLLHFEAVDWEAEVKVNGQAIGLHRGGYDPFAFDITDAVREAGPQHLTVAVWDPTDAGTQPRGKQVRSPGGIFYTSVTGIWGTVWLEPVPETFIEDYTLVPDIDGQKITLTVEASHAEIGDSIEVTALADGDVIANTRGPISRPLELAIPSSRLWSPDDPFLYDLQIQLVREGTVIDAVDGYFGMRKISVDEDEDGVPRLMLNNRFVFQSGTLDQGYWPDGLYTAPGEDAMVYDIKILKSMGFNMLRKHVKVEPRRFYAACDRLGLLVWQDMPNADIPLQARDSDIATDPEATAQFETELVRVIGALRNHPSIVMWVPFNEGWGQYDSERIAELVRATDPTRLVNHASGWYDRGAGDVLDRHSYPAPEPPEPDRRRASVQGEYGGLGFNVAGHMWTEEGWGYDLFPDSERLTERFEEFFKILQEAMNTRGLSAAVYTQTTDIETENNGLMTYDREVTKITPEAIALAHEGYFPPHVTRLAPIFVDETVVELEPPAPDVRIYYTTDGLDPSEATRFYRGPFEIRETTTVSARAYWSDGTASRTARFDLTKAEPTPALVEPSVQSGLSVEVFESDTLWRQLPDFATLTPIASTTADAVAYAVGGLERYFGLRFSGYIRVPETGVYAFHLTSDDGSRLFIDGDTIVDNDGIHGARQRSGYAALTAGLHSLELHFFQGAGGIALSLSLEGPQLDRQEIPPDWLFRSAAVR